MARRCCICGGTPKRVSHFLCTNCYGLRTPETGQQQIGTLRPMPLWLRELKRAQDREEYHEDTVAPRSVSLDAVMDSPVNRARNESCLRPIEPSPPRTTRARRRRVLRLPVAQEQEAA